MNNNMNIRKAVKQDIPQIENLLYQVQKVHSDKRPDIFKPGGQKYTTEDLIQILEDSSKPIYVAEKNGKILGYAFCIFKQHETSSVTNIKTLYIDDLCVTESARGQRIGRKIYNYVLDIAKQSKCYNVTLNVWACNEAAKKFYDKCGLQVQKFGMEQIVESDTDG